MELLKEIAENFEVLPANLDEDSLTVKDPWETAKVLALAKATEVAKTRPDALVIGSDTVVAMEIAPDQFKQLAKPSDAEDAVQMLKLLSAQEHCVVTAVALVFKGRSNVEADTTTVRFRQLADEEVRDYVATGEPMDKAGAYAIQGGASGFVSSTEGSISNVIGLPMELLKRMISELETRR